MSKFSALALIVLLAGAVAQAQRADTLDMRGTEDAARFEGAGKPTRGMSQARVEQSYGEPSSRRNAVGDPPISRWEYPDFVVFFEYDKVIHAVNKRR
jgi:hypothetical protein